MSVTYRALSLTQPWASLFACGVKRFETRSWSTAHRGPVAVHAAKGFPRAARVACEESPFAELLDGLGLSVETLPRGAVLGLVDVVECFRLTDSQSRRIVALGAGESLDLLAEDGPAAISRVEAALGDFSAGRFAWWARNARRFESPIPARGRLGLWLWAPPDDSWAVRVGGASS